MKTRDLGICVFATLALSACNLLPPKFANPNPGKIERVGILLVKQCNSDPSCSSFSLFDSGMRVRNSHLSGNISAAHKGKLIAVLGKGSLDNDGVATINVEKVRSITEFDYQPFLANATTEYTKAEFGCRTLWDQSFDWRLDKRQPILIATLVNPNAPESERIRLEYDGLNKEIVSVDRVPENVNPCR